MKVMSLTWYLPGGTTSEGWWSAKVILLAAVTRIPLY